MEHCQREFVLLSVNNEHGMSTDSTYKINNDRNNTDCQVKNKKERKYVKMRQKKENIFVQYAI
jgi:hypothetical protein